MWTGDKNELERIIEGWRTELENGGLKMNADKTEILCISRNHEEVQIMVNGTPIRNVEKVKFLGGTFTNEGNNTTEKTERISKYSNAVFALYPLLRDKYIPQQAKTIIFEGVLTPILMYASETRVPPRKNGTGYYQPK